MRFQVSREATPGTPDAVDEAPSPIVTTYSIPQISRRGKRQGAAQPGGRTLRISASSHGFAPPG